MQYGLKEQSYFFDVCVWDHIKNEDFRNNIIRDGKVIYKH